MKNVKERQSVIECFSAIGLSPFKSHSYCKVTAGKHKLSEAFTSMKSKVAQTLDVPVACLETQPLTPYVEIQEKALAFDNLMSQMKEKLVHLIDSKLTILIITFALTLTLYLQFT